MDTFPFEIYERFLVELPMETLMLIKKDEEFINKVLTSRSFWKHKVETILGYSIEMDFETRGYEVWKDIYYALFMDLNMNNLNKSFKEACEYGHTEVVALLLNDERVDPSADNNEAIRWASWHGHAEVVALLLNDERINLRSNNTAINWASENGHTEVVALLLKDERIDPSNGDNYAIELASENGHTEVVELLLQDPRVSSTYRK